MESYNKFAPSGLYCAMITPFASDGSVDYGKIRKILDFLIEHTVEGVCPVANIGEFLSLTLEQRKKIISTVCEHAAGKLHVVPGVNDLNLGNTEELCRHATSEGANGVLVCAPYYYPYSQSYLQEYLFRTADSSPLPVTFYNSPHFTNPVDFDILLSYLSHPNVTGMKESSGDIRFLMRVMDELKQRKLSTNVMMGWEELLLPGLLYGAKGCIVAGAGIFPELLRRILSDFSAGDLVHAAECELSIRRITEKLMGLGFPEGYKLGVAARGVSFRILQSVLLQHREQGLQQEIPKIEELIKKELSTL